MTELITATASSRDDSLRNSKKAHLSNGTEEKNGSCYPAGPESPELKHQSLARALKQIAWKKIFPPFSLLCCFAFAGPRAGL